MNVALLRVGVDSGCGGTQGPLFADGTFEFVPIPDMKRVDERTYGNQAGRHGRPLVEYFPASRRAKMRDQSMHVDPEFATFTYGDPTQPKRGLRRLEPGDLLAFYCGLQGWDFESAPALYLVGYFAVEAAGLAADFSDADRQRLFSENFHVRHPSVYARQRADLVLVKGSNGTDVVKQQDELRRLEARLSLRPSQAAASAPQTAGSHNGPKRRGRGPLGMPGLVATQVVGAAYHSPQYRVFT